MPLGPRLVELLVLTEAHEDLRRGVREVCSRFPASTGETSTRGAATREVRRGDDRGRIPRRAHTGEVRRYGPRPLGGVRDPRGGQPERRQRWSRPRPDVYHGHASQARVRRAEAAVPAKDSEGRSEAAGLRRHRARSWNRHDFHSHNSDARGRPLRGERAQDLHLQGRAV
jgi:hypothetical protein